jgi:DNA excision repair protein ERCC-6
VILDEGQKIKNHKSQGYQAAVGLQACHRLVLSGTPMQNNLTELWALFSYVEPGLLGNLEFFTQRFCSVIIKGGYKEATRLEQEMSKQCTQELRTLIQRHIIRRTKTQLKLMCNLPDRNEYILFCQMTPA